MVDFMEDKLEFYIKKLNEDDILEILTEYLLEKEFMNCESSRSILLGAPGKDLRFICILGKEDVSSEIVKCDIMEIDKKYNYNGDHSILEKNPKFQL